ncbi:GL19709 [Drosophila persimilis]|uniref:GL19709 n=1 Tax=Drosophila persimilis TaxID=7234 RepID=B4HD86_DROPE|nr:GL19709 [Drosophila persimilis]
MSRVNVTDHRERLSLPFLRELSLKNLDHIGDLRDLLTVKSMSSYILTVVTVIPLCVVIGILYRRLDARAPKQNADAAQSTENGRQPPIAPYRAPQVTTTSAKPGARLYQPPPPRRRNSRTPSPDRKQRSTKSRRQPGAKSRRQPRPRTTETRTHEGMKRKENAPVSGKAREHCRSNPRIQLHPRTADEDPPRGTTLKEERNTADATKAISATSA